MKDLLALYEQLKNKLSSAMLKLKIDELQTEYERLKQKTQKPDFWVDNLKAQNDMKRLGKLELQLSPWLELANQLTETGELLKTHDSTLQQELSEQLSSLSADFDKLKAQLKLAAPFDAYDAIISIHAGAGGTDAQDWAQMLQRMYARWAEANNLQLTWLDESNGDEAGIKSTTFGISGNYVYGRLKGEHGVHRLVRLSPFNSDNLRQTSFAKVEVVPKIDQPDDVKIDEKDLKVDVFRSGGHGGQSVNTTDSAVRVTHLPTGIVVAIQNERSQLQNKETALTILRSKLAQLQLDQHVKNLRELKGPNEQASWGNQIRSYVLHPYKQVKDLRTRHESSEPEKVLAGQLDDFIEAYLESQIGQ